MLIQDPVASSAMQKSTSYTRGTSWFNSWHHSSRPRAAASTAAAEATVILQDEGDPHPVISRVQSELATSLAAAASAEFPFTVKLRIWPYDIKDLCAHVDPEKCHLIISLAGLCRQVLPGIKKQAHHDALGAATSPTRHPISAQLVWGSTCITGIKGCPLFDVNSGMAENLGRINLVVDNLNSNLA